MLIGNDRDKVVENIKRAAESGDFYAKVEIGDPDLTDEEAKKLVADHIASRRTLGYKLRRFGARAAARVVGDKINKSTEVVGEADERAFDGGFIITSNHFGPLENTVISHYARQHGKRLNIVSQVTNFAMTGFLGFFMNYADTIPLPRDPHQMARDFYSVLEECIGRKEGILIYPEQEMWFNYRKPRPPRSGAYHFAAKLGCPIVSCFMEIIATDTKETEEFYETRYRLHVLGTLTCDPAKSVRENVAELSAADYALKKAAYEKCYGEPLDYTFSPRDIAGYIKN